MRTITPHLWFDTQAKEAADFYVATFPDSEITNVRTLYDTPSGDCDIVSFELFGQPFMSISAGPMFKFNPSVSFVVACQTKEEAQTYWDRLADGGTELMPLGDYPFSELFGWTQDRYGLSWQIMFAGEHEIAQRITPSLLFTGEVCGRAEEAINFYSTVFEDTGLDGEIARYGPGQEPETEGTVMHAGFRLEGQHFGAMDSAQNHNFSFNEAISLMVECRTQEEIDHYFDSLSAVPESEQCGWLKDKFGVSWQVVPTVMDEMMANATEEQMARVTEAFLQMKKFDLAELTKAYEG